MLTGVQFRPDRHLGHMCRCVWGCCRYTAAEALTALNKVYLMMMEANKGTNLAPMVVRPNSAVWSSSLDCPKFKA